MLNALFLAAATLSTTSGGTPSRPTVAPLSPLAGVTLAERPRGAHVADTTGIPLGVIDSSDGDRVTILTGIHKVQVPANALRQANGQLLLTVSAQALEQMLATSAAFQARTHPAPKPVTAASPVNGFKSLSEFSDK